MKVGFSPVAKTDLIDIAVYIAQDNPARALTFVDKLEAKGPGQNYLVNTEGVPLWLQQGAIRGQ